MRLCACLGVELDVIEPCAFPLSAHALRRTALDYLPLSRVARHASWEDFLALRGPRGRLVLLTTGGETRFPNFQFQPDDVLIVGSESAGAPPEVHRGAAARLRIPMAPGARSLNVVTAATLALGEALRQNTAFP